MCIPVFVQQAATSRIVLHPIITSSVLLLLHLLLCLFFFTVLVLDTVVLIQTPVADLNLFVAKILKQKEEE